MAAFVTWQGPGEECWHAGSVENSGIDPAYVPLVHNASFNSLKGSCRRSSRVLRLELDGMLSEDASENWRMGMEAAPLQTSSSMVR